MKHPLAMHVRDNIEGPAQADKGGTSPQQSAHGFFIGRPHPILGAGQGLKGLQQGRVPRGAGLPVHMTNGDAALA
jgi:hypothetical protein